MSYDASLALQGEAVYRDAPETHASHADVAKALSTPDAWRTVFKEGLKAVLESQLKSLSDHGKDSEHVLTQAVEWGWEGFTLLADKATDAQTAEWLFVHFFDGGHWPNDNN